MQQVLRFPLSDAEAVERSDLVVQADAVRQAEHAARGLPLTIRDLRKSFGALDALTRIAMQRLLERVWTEQSFTAILVTHDVSEAVALADRVLVIEDGRIAEDIEVAIARPRERGTAELAALEGAILRD